RLMRGLEPRTSKSGSTGCRPWTPSSLRRFGTKRADQAPCAVATSTHHLADDQPHAFWDNTFPARLRIDPGDTVVFETREGTGQITPETTSEKLAELDPSLIHALTGPVYVNSAKPGDSLEVEVMALEHHGWGWNGVIPGFGLLGWEFERPYIHHY